MTIFGTRSLNQLYNWTVKTKKKRKKKCSRADYVAPLGFYTIVKN